MSQACDYCGLPLAAGFRASAEVDTAEPAYCCYGCRFAAAVAQERGEVGQLRWNMTRLGLAIFFTMNVSVFTMVLWSLDVYPRDGVQTTAQATLMWDLFRYLGLIFSLPVLIMLGGPLLENAVRELRRGVIGTDWLLLIGVAAAYFYSAISTFRNEGHVYFEVGCLTLVAVTLGRWLEATGKWKATDALKSLAKLLPEHIRIVADGQQTVRPLAEVQPGDRLRVLPGERIPVDGRIVRGAASLDEQLISGESQPVDRSPGDEVFGGTLNVDGDLVVQATAAADGGALSRLMAAVVEAAAAGSRWQRLADRVSSWFLPFVFVLAGLTLAIHWTAHDFHNGLLAALAVVLIACPCALGVATPLAVWAALGAASRRGILFRDGDALARLANVTTIYFDKTGTLTDGLLHVDEFVVEDPVATEQTLLQAATLAASSTHVMSHAITAFANDRGILTSNLPLHSEVETLPGRGLSMWPHDGTRVLLGSGRLMHEKGIAFGSRIEHLLDTTIADERSCCFFASGLEVSGVFLLRETLRPAVVPMLSQLRTMNIDSCVLTGDREARARRLEEQLGISVRAGLLPEEKLAVLRRQQAVGHRVAMIGDGINDAPALAAADVGIALGCGADISREAADVCLIHNDLSAVPYAIRLAHAARRTIRQNLFWAFGYNVLGMLLAMTGWLNPIWASVAMVGSSLFVVSNSLRLSQQQLRLVGATTADYDGHSMPSSIRDADAIGRPSYEEAGV